jgi:hypothetical protein
MQASFQPGGEPPVFGVNYSIKWTVPQYVK